MQNLISQLFLAEICLSCLARFVVVSTKVLYCGNLQNDIFHACEGGLQSEIRQKEALKDNVWKLPSR